MSTDAADGKKVTLKSSDGETFEVEEAVASQFNNNVIEDVSADGAIRIPDITGKILSKVIEYCKKHVETPKTEDRATSEELKAWDHLFVQVDQNTLFDLIRAANYLNIKSLLDLTLQTAANIIKPKTGEEIKKYFNIKNTPEEVEEIRRENQWAVDL